MGGGDWNERKRINDWKGRVGKGRRQRVSVKREWKGMGSKGVEANIGRKVKGWKEDKVKRGEDMLGGMAKEQEGKIINKVMRQP